jgi:hypothetical protein
MAPATASSDPARWTKKDGHWELEVTDKVHLKDLLLLDDPKPDTGDRWGGWVYDAKAHALAIQDGSKAFTVPLSDIHTAHDMVIALSVVAGKGWIPVGAIGDFVRALDSILDLWKVAST